MKLYCLQNTALRTFGNFPRRTPVGECYMAFKIPHIYDYIRTFCRQLAEAVQNHENADVLNIIQGEEWRRKYKRLKLGCGQAYDRSND
jgi:hypothetical protein